MAPNARVNFVLHNHPTLQKHMVETMTGGVAAFHYNGDGLKDSSEFYNRLYCNDGGMKFTDVTLEAGVTGPGYSMRVATPDFVGDGRRVKSA